MSDGLLLLSGKIKSLRENMGLTQTEIAHRLEISRSGVNAWEMGVSVPSPRYIIELSKIFGVSTDYLLGINDTSTISVEGLSEKQVSSLLKIIECFKDR